MSRVLLIRPGATAFDEQHRVQGILDLPLSDRGRVETPRRQVHGLACIDVVDTGIGMDPARVDGYFKAFQQGDARSDGLGIGLWIVRQTAEALAAELDVVSALGEGTRITVRLPAP